MFCLQCGNQLPDGAPFCNMCGARQSGNVQPSGPRMTNRQAGSTLQDNVNRYAQKLADEKRAQAATNSMPRQAGGNVPRQAGGNMPRQAGPGMSRQAGGGAVQPEKRSGGLKWIIGGGAVVAVILLIVKLGKGQPENELITYEPTANPVVSENVQSSGVTGRPTDYDDLDNVEALKDYARRLEEAGNTEAAEQIYSMIPQAAIEKEESELRQQMADMDPMADAVTEYQEAYRLYKQMAGEEAGE